MEPPPCHAKTYEPVEKLTGFLFGHGLCIWLPRPECPVRRLQYHDAYHAGVGRGCHGALLVPAPESTRQRRETIEFWVRTTSPSPHTACPLRIHPSCDKTHNAPQFPLKLRTMNNHQEWPLLVKQRQKHSIDLLIY